MDSNHCQVIGRTITGQRAVDEKVFDSLAVLTERLERLKRLDERFCGISFSPAVEKLASRKNIVAVC